MYYLFETEILEDEIFIYNDSKFDFITELNKSGEENKKIFSEFKHNLLNNKSNVKITKKDKLYKDSKFLCVKKIGIEIYDINSNEVNDLKLLDIFNRNRFSQEPFPIVIKFKEQDNEVYDDVMSEMNEWGTISTNINKIKGNDKLEAFKLLPKREFKLIVGDLNVKLLSCSFIQYVKNKKNIICILVNKIDVKL